MFRSVFIPAKKKPKRGENCCGKLLGCPQCRYSIKEWKKTEALRKSLTQSKTASNIDLSLLRFSLLAFFLNIGAGGLMMSQEDNDGAFKAFIGALFWVIPILIFDHNAKEDK